VGYSEYKLKKKNMAKEKVVVVGGAGFIGSHIVDACLERGWDTHIIDNFAGGKRNDRINDDATLHKVDIRNYEDIAPIIKGATYVFHLAALPRVQYSIENPQETNDVNIGGTVNVLEAAHQGGVLKVIYSASSSAYGDQETMPLVETMPTNPKSPYGLQKLVGEEYCKVYNLIHGLKTVSLRYFNVYGSRFDPEGAYALVIGKFLKQKKEGTPLTITGDGNQTRDFTHVDDVVRANLLSAENDSVGGGEVFNIGAGKQTTINEIADMVGGEKEYIAPRLEPYRTQADNTLAKKYLTWEPEIALKDGIDALKKEWDLD
jgi:UDP-glucose 4-epimerase